MLKGKKTIEIFFNFKQSATFASHLNNAQRARMAELVDALVSNTSDSNIVPVRSRLRVQRS